MFIAPAMINIFAKGVVTAVLMLAGQLKQNARQIIRVNKNSLRVKNMMLIPDVAATADIFDPAYKKEAEKPPFQNSPKD